MIKFMIATLSSLNNFQYHKLFSVINGDDGETGIKRIRESEDYVGMARMHVSHKNFHTQRP